jgi:protein subunit release factor B
MELAKKLYENVMGTPEQNEKAKKEMAEQDAKNPDTTQAKVNRMIEKVKPTKEPVKKAKGGTIKSSASKRADGCAIKGKTRGRMV